MEGWITGLFATLSHPRCNRRTVTFFVCVRVWEHVPREYILQATRSKHMEGIGCEYGSIGRIVKRLHKISYAQRTCVWTCACARVCTCGDAGKQMAQCEHVLMVLIANLPWMEMIPLAVSWAHHGWISSKVGKSGSFPTSKFSVLRNYFKCLALEQKVWLSLNGLKDFMSPWHCKSEKKINKLLLLQLHQCFFLVLTLSHFSYDFCLFRFFWKVCV